MADVTGQFGDQEVVLNNAATEATLKQLLQSMNALAAKQGVKIKNDAELDKQLGRLGKTTQDGVRAGKEFGRSNKRLGKELMETADAAAESRDLLGAMGASTRVLLTGLGKLSKGIQDVTGFIGSALSSAAGMGDSISGATDALGQIPLGVGTVVKNVFGPVAGAVEATQKSFQQAAAVGANFGGNLNEFANTAAQAGMTMDQFAGVVANNAQGLMFLGGSTSEGAKRLGQMGKMIRQTELGDELARLGYSTTDINEGLAEYSGRLARNGRAEELSNRQLVNLTGQYLKNLDAVSKLTGKSKEALQAEQDARQADAQYRIMLSKLGPKQQAEMEKLMDSIPKAHQTGIKEILATGTATSDEGVKAMAFLRESGGEAQKLFQQMQSGQGLQEGFANDFYNTYSAEAKKFGESPIGETLGKFDASMNDFVVASLDVGARQKTLAEIQVEIEEEQRKLKEKIAANTGEVLDPATIKTFKENIAQAATEFQTALANVNLGPLEKTFQSAVKAAKDYLIPAINIAGENFDKLVTAVVAGEVAMKALAIAATLAAGAQGLGAIKNMVTGGGAKAGAGAAASSGAKAGASGAMKGAAKTAMRRLGPLGLLYGLYEGYTTSQEIEKDLEAGTITSGEAGKQQSANVGGVVGGTGGALAGAAAGAAVGSVVPVVGTAIGGLIGGAIGYWAGSSAGKAVGGQIGEALIGDETIQDIEAKIKAEQERIKRSQEGVNEYWGSEKSGREDSMKTIEQLQKDLALIKQNNAEFEKKNSTATGSPNSPSTGANNANDGMKSDAEKMHDEAAKKAEELRKQKEEAEKMKGSDTPYTDKMVGTVKKTSEELLQELNNNIQNLIQLGQDQLKAAKGTLSATKDAADSLQ